MSSSIKNVTVFGATGALGSVILDKLVASGKFNVRVLKRLGSTSTVPGDLEVIEADLTSLEAMKSALTGQDAVVSAVGREGMATQILLIDAAASAGVKRFLPSDFGSNLANAKARELPVYAAKIQTHEKVIEASQTTGLSYTLVYNNAFLDWGIEHDFLISTTNGKPLIANGGDLPFSATTLTSIGDAVVGVLSHPDETKNRSVYVHDLVTTQNKLLALAKQAAPDKVWEPVDINLDDMVARAREKLAKGQISVETFAPFLYRAVLDPEYGGRFEQTDNELLGVKGKTDQDVIELFRKHLNIN
ncbi:putative oxidoreductase CipA-like protein [Xylariales sp. PMI_506]|nr:putative oxidoreductase CipA-like protein [Xylariales sp. PMI_506]